MEIENKPEVPGAKLGTNYTAHQQLTAISRARKELQANKFKSVSDATKEALSAVGIEPEEYIGRLKNNVISERATVRTTVGIRAGITKGLSG